MVQGQVGTTTVTSQYKKIIYSYNTSPHPQPRPPWTTLSQAHWQSGADLLVISRPVISGGVFILLVPCIGLLHHQAPLMPVNWDHQNYTSHNDTSITNNLSLNPSRNVRRNTSQWSVSGRVVLRELSIILLSQVHVSLGSHC